MSTKKKIQELERDLEGSFNNVKIDIDKISNGLGELAQRHIRLERDQHELKEQLATNGVIRDIRQLQRAVENINNNFEELKNNGVATSINKLNEEVFHKKRDAIARDGWDFGGRLTMHMLGLSTANVPQEPTLAGKVDAIIEYLGIDLTVQPEKKTPTKIVATKPAPKKKASKK